MALEKLSADDIAYLDKLAAMKGEEAKIRLVATKFFNALRKSDEEREEQVRDVITTKSRENLTGSGSEIKSLPKPDRSAKSSVRSVEIDGDTAEATVRLRFKGKSITPTIMLRKEDDGWLVYAITGPDENDEITTISFEGKDNNVSANRPLETAREVIEPQEMERERGNGRPPMDVDEDAATTPPEKEPVKKAAQGAHGRNPQGGGNPHERPRESREGGGDEVRFRVPDGNSRRLLKFIDTTIASEAPHGANSAEFQQQQSIAIQEAASRVLKDKSATKAQREKAGKSLVDAAMLLLDGDPKIAAEQIEELPEELARRGLDDAVPYANAAGWMVDLKLAQGPDERKSAIQQVVHQLESLPIDRVAVDLAIDASRASRSLDDVFVAATHTQLAQILAKSPDEKVQQLGDKFAGTGRRFGLVGGEMTIEGITAEGQPFDWGDYSGKVVLIDFWATWCGPCRAEMPNVLKNYEKYRENGFEVVAISVDDNLNALEEYLESESPPWTVLVDEHPENKGKSVAAFYGIDAIPATVLIGSDGKVITLQARGRQLDSQLERLFEDAA